MKQTIYEEIQRMALLSKYDNSKTLSEQQKIIDAAAAAEAPKFNWKSDPKYAAEVNAQIAKDSAIPTTTDPWTKFPCVTGYAGAKKTTQKLDDGSVGYFINNTYYWSSGIKVLNGETSEYTCDDPEFKTAAVGAVAKNTQTQKTIVPIPTELKDKVGIMAFQDWLDGNVPGWAEGYKDGKLSKGVVNAGFKSGGYGKFGPRTQKIWNNPTYKDAYMKSLEKPVEQPIEKPIQKIQTGYEDYTVDEPIKQPVETPTEQPEGS